jgi:hypothetical protein
MKRMAFVVCVVVLVLAVAVQAQTQAQPKSESVEQELIKLENGWMEAFLKSDIAFFFLKKENLESALFARLIIFLVDGQ